MQAKSGDVYRIGSLGRNTDGIFSREHQYDDEEALKWAALERLPTYNRARKGILIGRDGGGAKEMNMANMSAAEKTELLERMARLMSEGDHEKFLTRFQERIEK